MMSGVEEATLVAAIKLASSPETIGVPVFRGATSDVLLVPETDTSLSITRFCTFYNEACYLVSFELPEHRGKEAFRLGDPCPIPVWVAGKLAFVPSDCASLAALDELVAPGQHWPIKAAAYDIIDSARDGVYSRQARERRIREFIDRFPEVFADAPDHSHYWVDRYRQAVAESAGLGPDSDEIKLRLKSTVLDWLGLYATKTDITRLRTLLGAPEDGILMPTEIDDWIAQYLFKRVTNRTTASLFNQLIDWFPKAFPRGLLGREGGGGDIPARLSGRTDEFLIQAMQTDRLDEGFTPSLAVALIFYGGRDAPPAVRKATEGRMSQIKDEWTSAMSRYTEVAHLGEGQEHLTRARHLYEAMRQVDAIANAHVRLHPTGPERYGIHEHEHRLMHSD